MSLSFEEATAKLTEPGARFEVGLRDVRGIPTKVWINAPTNLAEAFASSEPFSDRTYLVYEDESYTYGEIHASVNSLVQALREVGVGPGDRVAIAMRNYPEWVVAFWATVISGAIAVPLNAWWSGAELAYGIEDSGSKVLILDGERTERISPHLPELSQDQKMVLITVRSAAQALASPHLAVMAFEEALSHTPVGTLQLPHIDPEADAAIFYTSGTTGRPKGAVLSHRNIVSCLMNAFFSSSRKSLMEKNKDPRPEGPSKRQTAILLSVPLFHATGCFANLIPNTVAGGKIVLMYRWNPEKALELIERERITTFGGVPAMVWQVLNSDDFEKRDLSSVESIGYGGAPSAPELVRRIRMHFPTSTPTNGYGLTETSAIATLNVGENYARKPDSAGPPLPVIDIQVVDSEGAPVPIDTTGELWIKGPTVVRGYWNKPEASREAFVDGWLRSGDIAYLDDENYVHIVDRAKDMVIRGGENIYSIEVEAALFEHSAVADAAVIGVPDLVLGEEVGAIVQLRPGATATEGEIREHVASRLAAFKVPRYVYLRDDALPRNAAGKILKRQLRDEVVEIEAARE